MYYHFGFVWSLSGGGIFHYPHFDDKFMLVNSQAQARAVIKYVAYYTFY
jgi:hypothetical protein